MDEKEFGERLSLLSDHLEEATRLRDHHLQTLVQANRAVDSFRAVTGSLGTTTDRLDVLKSLRDSAVLANEKACYWQGKFEAYAFAMRLWGKK